jgi:two-component system, NarL family, sensor histidine kinase EvgS
MSSPSILRLIRLMTLFVLVWAASSVSAEPLRVEREKQTTQDYSTLTRDESQARRSEPMPGSTGTGQSQTLSLSVDERAYLRSLPPLTLGVDASWAPFSYVDSSGESRGIAVAYATYLSKALDIDLERHVYPDWTDVSNAFAHGQIDMLATTERETPRLAGGISTGSVADYPLVIVGRPGEPAMKGIEDASSRRIVVTARLAASGRLGNLPSGAATIIAPNLNAALDRVARGEADLFVGDLVAVDIALAARYEDELKIIGPAGDFEHMTFALRPEFSRLVPLIDRALSAISDADKQRILAARQAAFDPPSSGWSVSAMRLLPALIAIGVVLAVTLRAFVLLQREMARRVETEQRLATQLSFQQTMMEVVPYPLVAKDRENRYIAVNRAFEKDARAEARGHHRTHDARGSIVGAR